MKKMMIGAGVLVAVAVVVVVGFAVVRNMSAEKFENHMGNGKVQESTPMKLGENELLAGAETQEEAQEIARLYDIVLVEYSDGVAVYATDKEPQEVIRFGEENGYPKLEMNVIQSID